MSEATGLMDVRERQSVCVCVRACVREGERERATGVDSAHGLSTRSPKAKCFLILAGKSE